MKRTLIAGGLAAALMLTAAQSGGSAQTTSTTSQPGCFPSGSTIPGGAPIIRCVDLTETTTTTTTTTVRPATATPRRVALTG